MSRVTAPPARCFQGIVPSFIGTASFSGTPNVTYLSHVDRLDDRHVALSCQFFNKTKRNVLENPNACVFLHDPLTFEAWRLRVRFLRAEHEGPVFDRMATRIEAIASQTGMSGVFRLLSADVYEVLACEKVEGYIDAPDVPEVDDPGGARSELRGLQIVSQRASQAATLEALLAGVLESLEVAFGFEHAMLFLAEGAGSKLRVAAARGYAQEVVGAEVAVGDGLIGVVARDRRLLRLSGVDAELRYGRAIRNSLEHAGQRRALRPEMPLAGLPDAESHLAMPLLVGDVHSPQALAGADPRRLVGVLAVESRAQLGFDEWDEAFLEIVANQLAVALDRLQARGPEAPPAAPAPRPTLHFHFYAHDDCVFLDDGYLIRNVPGRILWKLLRAYAETGRTEFSNRELRLDPWIGLPPVRDNLESRLALLRKRLELKCPALCLPSTSRGCFRLEVDAEIVLSESDASLALP